MADLDVSYTSFRLIHNHTFWTFTKLRAALDRLAGSFFVQASSNIVDPHTSHRGAAALLGRPALKELRGRRLHGTYVPPAQDREADYIAVRTQKIAKPRWRRIVCVNPTLRLAGTVIAFSSAAIPLSGPASYGSPDSLTTVRRCDLTDGSFTTGRDEQGRLADTDRPASILKKARKSSFAYLAT